MMDDDSKNSKSSREEVISKNARSEEGATHKEVISEGSVKVDTVIGGKSNRKKREVKALSLPANKACSGGQPVALTLFGCVHGWTNTASRSACSTLCCGRLFSCDGDRFDCYFMLGKCLTWYRMFFISSEYASRGFAARKTN